VKSLLRGMVFASYYATVPRVPPAQNCKKMKKFGVEALAFFRCIRSGYLRTAFNAAPSSSRLFSETH